jgi:magnesium chelatase subunit I
MQFSASAATADAPLKRASRVPPLPFVKVAGQEEMKLALLLNVVDPGIGGVLIMGDRGTGKSIAVSPI